MKGCVVIVALVFCAACARNGEEARGGETAAVVDAAPDTAAPVVTPRDTPATPAATPPPSGGRNPTPPPRRDPMPSRPPSSVVSREDADTLRGTVAVVGATPLTEVVIRPGRGASVTIVGNLAREIGVASGADVWVQGRRIDARTFDASRYEVRTVDGNRAITGTLTREGDRLVLVTTDGERYPFARPPDALRSQVGARIWVTGDPRTTIVSYGVLRRP